MSPLATRGGRLATLLAAALLITAGLAVAGTFGGCSSSRPAATAGRPSQAVSSAPRGAVAQASAESLAETAPHRTADSWGEIRAREFVYGAFDQYGYYPRLQEFIATRAGERVHSANIVAVKEGESAVQLVIGAHYDGAGTGQAYSDNATGVGLLLELAGRLKRTSTPYTLVFVAFGAEEKGLLGSSYYVRSLSDGELRSIKGMIDLDAVAGGGDQLVVTTQPGMPGWLRDDALAAAQQLGVPLTTSPATGGHEAGAWSGVSDDRPFSLADIPTATFTPIDASALARDKLSTVWHTKADTVARVEKASPGRTRRQLRDLTRVFETLLTSRLETHK